MLIKSSIEKYGLDDWTNEFDEIWGKVNKDRRIEFIWLHAVDHASMLHENLRVGDYEKALVHIADLFCWVCALTTKAHKVLGTNKSLQDIVLSKFPYICFYCCKKTCKCSQLIGRGIEDSEKKKKLRDQSLIKVKQAREALRASPDEPKTVQDIVEMYITIYDHINFRTPLEIIMAHLQEEVGEVASCLNDLTDKLSTRTDPDKLLEFQHEIADVITWIVALTLKIDYILAAGAIYLSSTDKISTSLSERLKKRSIGVSLSNVLWAKFQEPNKDTLWCPDCSSRPCKLTFVDHPMRENGKF